VRVLLFYSVGDTFTRAHPLNTQEQLQFGLSYISSILKQHGHQTDLLVVSSIRASDNAAAIRARIESFRPDVVGFHAVATEFAYVESVARYVRSAWPHCYLIIGGPHAILCPEQALNGPFDAVCIGEGDYAALELVTQLSEGRPPTGIAGLWLRDGERVERNPPRPFLQDLDALPFPDRDMWVEYFDYPVSRPSLLLGRGCPFSCSYCCNHALKKTAPGRYVRTRSPASIAAEVADLRANHRFPQRAEIYLEIESFGVDIGWAVDVCRKLKELSAEPGPALRYGANLRVVPDMDLERLFTAMAEADFRHVNIGLEAGSERVRREVLRRRYSNDDVISATEVARRHGLEVHLFNMIGLPGETYSDHLETVRINRLCQPDRNHTGVFFPYPGTDLYRRCAEMGLPVDRLDVRRERMHAVMDLPGFSAGQIQRALWLFNFRVYRGRKSPAWWIPPPLIRRQIPLWLQKPLKSLYLRLQARSTR
jgi:anaerobic magnesium-protoporphyrin IX monomethyl ester cyclase